jgi:2-keto-4-pentenoate hydratase
MAMTNDEIRLAAEALHQAEKTRTQIRQLSQQHPGLAAAVLGHPATSVAWLANKIAPHGLALEPGQVVLAGSLIRPIEARKGDTIQADYGPYGTVSCYFA